MTQAAVLIDRVLSRCELDIRTGCWVRGGWGTGNGYSKLSVGGRHRVAHRVLYAVWHGVSLPPDVHIDHTCRNRACCNPEHLEAVSVRENTLRGEAVLFTPEVFR